MLNSLKRSLLWRWRKGFKPRSKTFFDLAHNAQGDYSSYMPDAAFRPLALTNGTLSRALLNDKLLFEKIVAPYAPVPPTLALIEHGDIIAPTPSGDLRTLDALLEYVQTQPVTLKPAKGA